MLGDLEEEYRERRARRGGLAADVWYWAQLLTVRPFRLRRALRPVAARWYASPWSFIRSLRDRPMEALLQNLRHIFRRLGRSPVFTAAAILSLGLGIGANTALFSLTNAIFLRDRGIAEPERVVQVFRNSGGPYWRVTFEDYRRMRDDLDDLFADVTAFTEDGVRLEDSDEVVAALRVAGDYFGVMGVQPAQGRSFVPGVETDVAEPPRVAILSHDLWQRAFGGDPDMVGRQIRIDARPTTVVGILPEDFAAKATGIAMDVFVPNAEAVLRPDSDNLWASGRLRPGVSLAQARAGLERVAAAYNEDRPESLRPVAFNAVSEADVSVHPGFDETIGSITALLFVVVTLVLLIACTNLASFLLARASDRRKEFAVRRAMGAGRGRIVGQLLGESMVLGMLGGAAGLALAYGSLGLLFSVQIPIPVEVNLDVSPDWRVLGFTLGVSLLAGALFGMFPAVQASRAPVAPTLRDESTGSTGTRRTWNVRSSLVAAQVTLSLVLLMAAGLFLRSLWAASSIDPGFESDGVALTTVDPATSGYSEEEARSLYDELLRRTRDLPGVERAALGTRIPLQLGNWSSGIQRSDVTPPPGREWRYAEVAMVTPDYLETLAIARLSGRGFEPTDDAGAPPVVVLNRAAVRMLWGDEEARPNAVGQPLKLSWRDEEGRIVGVVEDVKVHTLGEDPEPMVYVPLDQRYSGSVILVAKSGAGDGSALAPRLRGVAKELDPDLYVHGAMTARQSMGAILFLPRMASLLLGVFGGLALIMSAIGLYGVVSHTVASRQKEVGIRLALGAEAGAMVHLMMRGGLWLVGVGLVLGTGLALGAGLLLERFLFGVSGTDPLTFLTVPVVLLSVAVAAAWVPARRVIRMDPARALRSG